MDWLRQLSLRLGLILAHWGGWTPPAPITEYVRIYEKEECQRRHDVVCGLPHECTRPHGVACQLHDVPGDLYERALSLVRQQDEEYAPLSERKRNATGESRRHAVYAQLLKDFPDTRKRVISRAIEAALP